MRTLFIGLFIGLSFSAIAQETLKTKRIHVVFRKDGDPVRAYSNDIDYYTFIKNKPYWAQEVKLQYYSDSSEWKPSDKLLIDDIYYPEELSEKFLMKKTVYVTIQKYNNLASMIFSNLEDCKRYADNWSERYIEIPYFYRNKASYDEVIRLRKIKQ